MNVNHLPDVDEVKGAQLIPANEYRKMEVEIQYVDSDGNWYEIAVPFLDAMYLLNILKKVKEESGYNMPE